jgi:hypothetical protein
MRNHPRPINYRGKIEAELQNFLATATAEHYGVPVHWVNTGDPAYGDKYAEYLALFQYNPIHDAAWCFRCNPILTTDSEVKEACRHYLKAIEQVPIGFKYLKQGFIDSLHLLLASDEPVKLQPSF